ncbi:MAG: hypothetical protein SFY69_03120 [Planctomycetota bacterium]|nr:hypothetical protein [Planctomycetota bacterium]
MARTAIAALALVTGSIASAQPTIDWYTIDGGGGTSSGASFVLSGTIGQPDAGVMSGGSFTLTGGFWVGGSNGGPAPCDPDVNCDGNVDQDDVACLVQAVAGEGSCICTDPDFNQDGNVDQDDIEALTQVVAGSPCP